MGFSFKKLAQGLLKTKESIVSKLKTAVGLHKKSTPSYLDEIEEILISADISVETTGRSSMTSKPRRQAGNRLIPTKFTASSKTPSRNSSPSRATERLILRQ